MTLYTYTVDKTTYNIDNTINAIVGDTVDFIGYDDFLSSDYGLGPSSTAPPTVNLPLVPGCTYTHFIREFYNLAGTLTTPGTYILTKSKYGSGITGYLTLIVLGVNKCKVGGTWKTVTNFKVKVGGVWKTASLPKCKIGGVWK